MSLYRSYFLFYDKLKSNSIRFFSDEIFSVRVLFKCINMLFLNHIQTCEIIGSSPFLLIHNDVSFLDKHILICILSLYRINNFRKIRNFLKVFHERHINCLNYCVMYRFFDTTRDSLSRGQGFAKGISWNMRRGDI